MQALSEKHRVATFALLCRKMEREEGEGFVRQLGVEVRVEELAVLAETGHWVLIREALAKQGHRLRVELQQEEATAARVWGALARSMQQGSFLEVKLWLVLEWSGLIPVSFVRTFCETATPFAASRNPIKCCLLYHEVLGRFERRFSLLKSLIHSKGDAVLQLCSHFLEEVDSERALREILSDTDLTGYPVHDLIKKHPELLLQIETAIERDWTGPIDILTPETFELSSLFSVLRSHKPGPLGFGPRSRLRAAHPFQFRIFRRSPVLKYYLQLFFSLCIALFV